MINIKDERVNIDGIDVLVTMQKEHDLSQEDMKNLEKIIKQSKIKIDKKLDRKKCDL